MTKRRNLPNQLRWSVLSRDRFTCRYCTRSAPEVELHIDHVIPVSKGGEDTMENLVAACTDCNSGKSDSLVDGVPASASGAKSARQRHPLIGYAFLSFRNGKVSEQGLIREVVETGGRTFAVCQYFEWLMGDSTYCRMIDIEALSFCGDGTDREVTYRLFSSNEDRNSYYEWKTHKGASFEEGAK